MEAHRPQICDRKPRTMSKPTAVTWTVASLSQLQPNVLQTPAHPELVGAERMRVTTRTHRLSDAGHESPLNRIAARGTGETNEAPTTSVVQQTSLEQRTSFAQTPVVITSPFQYENADDNRPSYTRKSKDSMSDQAQHSQRAASYASAGRASAPRAIASLSAPSEESRMFHQIASYPSTAQVSHASSMSRGHVQSPCVLRITLGTLAFRGHPGLSMGGWFDMACGCRIIVCGFNTESPVRWSDSGPVTRRQEIRYSRNVTGDGCYSTCARCEFDESIDLPCGDMRSTSQCLVADVWLERQTVVKQLDSLLTVVGLGSNLPAFERSFLGRVAAAVPPRGKEVMCRAWPVASPAMPSEFPQAQDLSIGLEWVDEADTD